MKVNGMARIKNFILENWAIGLVLLLSFGLRLYKLGYHDLWYDEAFTVTFSKFFHFDWNPPAYHILMHFWIKIFGVSEAALRFPALLFSFFSVGVLFLLGKELFNRKIGLLASIFIGLSPFHIWYAQEARNYSMMLFFGLLSSYFFLRALRENTNRLWFMFVLVSAVSILSNYFGLILFMAQGIYLICIVKRTIFFKELFFLLGAILIFICCAPLFFQKFLYLLGGFWIPQPTLSSLVVTLENFILGYTGSHYLYLASDILMVIAAIYLFFNFQKALFLSLSFCLLLLVLPLAITYLFSKVLFSIYLDRGLILFSPYLYLALSVGIANLKNRWIYIFIFLLIVLMGVSNYRYFSDQIFPPIEHHIGSYIKKPVKNVAAYLDEQVKYGDLICYTNESFCPLLNLYMKKRNHLFFRIFDPAYKDTNWERVFEENYFNIPYYKIVDISFSGLWVIFTDWSRSGNLEPFSLSIKNWLDRNLKMVIYKEFDGLFICKYEKLK